MEKKVRPQGRVITFIMYHKVYRMDNRYPKRSRESQSDCKKWKKVRPQGRGSTSVMYRIECERSRIIPQGRVIVSVM